MYISQLALSSPNTGREPTHLLSTAELNPGLTCAPHEVQVPELHHAYMLSHLHQDLSFQYFDVVALTVAGAVGADIEDLTHVAPVTPIEVADLVPYLECAQIIHKVLVLPCPVSFSSMIR